jgi:hypothetical protein
MRRCPMNVRLLLCVAEALALLALTTALHLRAGPATPVPVAAQA